MVDRASKAVVAFAALCLAIGLGKSFYDESSSKSIKPLEVTVEASAGNSSDNPMFLDIEKRMRTGTEYSKLNAIYESIDTGRDRDSVNPYAVETLNDLKSGKLKQVPAGDAFDYKFITAYKIMRTGKGYDEAKAEVERTPIKTIIQNLDIKDMIFMNKAKDFYIQQYGAPNPNGETPSQRNAPRQPGN